MYLNKIHNCMFFVFTSIFVMLSGCSNVGVNANSEENYEVGYGTKLEGKNDVGIYISSRPPRSSAVHILRTANVVWIDNPDIKYQISKTQKGYKPEIEYSDKASAQHALEQIIRLYKESSVEAVKEKLSRNGVLDGEEVTLELTPAGAAFEVFGKRRLGVRVSIKQKGTNQVLWTTIILAYGPPSVVDHVLLNNFVSALEKELKIAGWLG